MKKCVLAVTFFSLISLVGGLSCSSSNKASSRVDYSNCPYIGKNGSIYERTAGSGSTYMVMRFWFYSNGTGSWGYSKSSGTEVYTFHYSLSGNVNVTFVEDESKERNSGYFSTFSDIGQGFVSEGVIFYRIS